MKHWVLGSFCPDRLLRGFTHLIACFTCLKPQLYKRVEPFKPSEKDEKSSGNVDESGTEEGICEALLDLNNRCLNFIEGQEGGTVLSRSPAR